VDGLEGETAAFPLSCTGCGISVFNLLLACEDCTGETKSNLNIGINWWW
jgi:hypothetical protein